MANYGACRHAAAGCYATAVAEARYSDSTEAALRALLEFCILLLPCELSALNFVLFAAVYYILQLSFPLALCLD